MKVYIAGPMTGYKNLNYDAFNTAEEILLEQGHEVRNPAKVEVPDGVKPTWEWFMKRTIPMMLECDVVVCLAGCAKSKGATMEMRIANELGIDVKLFPEFLGVDFNDRRFYGERDG